MGELRDSGPSWGNWGIGETQTCFFFFHQSLKDMKTKLMPFLKNNILLTEQSLALIYF